ncbi:tripartite-type tricarboxylate transporter receptor subunit TctC [Caldalkalibacillus uzonensis]|uniref:Tripartite-type tricarboxylate transporter receptor subunit TctC n=1 Tax=Caldalkalibacillus uzonensis TaxID=353224 RepID=A0ABU0CV06_9BACI|nr:tripartite tricarboxylate transporter substrate binding protein [Caldalkalibacillus uzonensis]MDQ0339957.1 tripartite-type tricarboxylate transporter receptor subunit TctC [Caldalkalibacillus uzonensis]
MKNSKLWLITLVLALGLAMVLTGCGGGTSSESSDSDQGEGNDAGQEAQNLSQEEVIAEIDRITDEVNAGNLTLEEGIEELKAVIPKPEGYPERKIEYVIAWGEGGGSDLYARHIIEDAQKILGVDIIPNNMPGGNGEVGLAYVLSQPADGYTLYGAVATQVVNEALEEQPHSFTEDTDFIIRNQGATEVYWVKADSPFKTFDDVIAAEKENPGSVTMIGGGIEDEIRLAELNSQLGTEIVNIPSQGSGERVASLLGGHVDILHETTGAVIDLYKDGQIRPILLPNEAFREAFPDEEVQTVEDIGVDITVSRWRGINAPKGLDPEIKQYLHNVFYAASKLPFYKNYHEENFFHLTEGYLNSEDYEDSAKEEVKVIREILEETGYVE